MSRVSRLSPRLSTMEVHTASSAALSLQAHFDGGARIARSPLTLSCQSNARVREARRLCGYCLGILVSAATLRVITAPGHRQKQLTRDKGIGHVCRASRTIGLCYTALTFDQHNHISNHLSTRKRCSRANTLASCPSTHVVSARPLNNARCSPTTAFTTIALTADGLQ